MTCILQPDQIEAFHRDGYVIVKSMFDAEETALLRRAMEEDPEIQDHILVRADGEGGGDDGVGV